MKIKDLKLVEIELFSYCNRTCKWCPNSYIDRKSENKYLDFDLFVDLIKELKNKDFNGIISFSRYNEPFVDTQRMAMGYMVVNYYLPNITMVANTNGDYDYTWFKDKIEITEMDYDNTKQELIDQKFRIMKLKNINNRGGALQNIKKEFIRKIPCYEPQLFAGINYDGTVSPCCNIRSDIPKHKPFIMGNLHYDTLENILNYPQNKDFRNHAAWGINEYLPEPCKHCDKEPGRYTSGDGIGGKQT